MSRKAPLVTTMLVVVLSWIAVSCSGPIFIRPPAAAAPAAAPVAASAGTPVAAIAAPNFMYFAVPMLGFAALGGALFMLQGKATESV